MPIDLDKQFTITEAADLLDVTGTSAWRYFHRLYGDSPHEMRGGSRQGWGGSVPKLFLTTLDLMVVWGWRQSSSPLERPQRRGQPPAANAPTFDQVAFAVVCDPRRWLLVADGKLLTFDSAALATRAWIKLDAVHGTLVDLLAWVDRTPDIEVKAEAS